MRRKTSPSAIEGGARKGLKSKAHRLIDGVYRRHPCVAQSTAAAVLRAVDSSLSKQMLSFLEKGDHNSLVAVKINALDYDDAEDFRRDYLCVEFMSKFPHWKLGINREEIALENFHDAERRCSASNEVLARAIDSPSTGVSTASYLYTAQRKIARLLGPFSWDEAEQDFGFGPGATYALPRKLGDTYHKLGVRPEVTRECAVLAYTALRRCPMWFKHVAALGGGDTIQDVFNIVPGNRITTVPKNAKTDRVIAIEPLMNMFIQKGIGGVIRRRLRRVGIDLTDQTINQRLAREGSLNGRLATIDLSMASDTVSLMLCRELLPPDWFQAIELARSREGVLPDGSRIVYQKVSSMGNGFTFEIESLIFWALCSAVIDFHAKEEKRLAVYGDDLVVPVECYEPVERLLNHCGFKLNEKKSYATGPFRESCGKHYFNGSDVSPFYVRDHIDDFMSTVLLCNNLRRWASRDVHWGLSGWCHPIHEELRALLPPFWRRPRISDGFGDGALIGDFDEVCPKKAPKGYEGYIGIAVAEQSATASAEDLPYLLKGLFSLEKSPPLVIPTLGLFRVGRDRKFVKTFREAADGASATSMVPYQVLARKPRYRVVKPVIPQWVNIGPWWV